MEHRYNYFDQNPNAIVNGQSTFNRSSVDGTQLTNNYSGSISSTSSQNQSPFHDRKYTNPNAVPLMNSHLHQIDSSNQPPRSSGPPRTNAKGIYENIQSSIPNAMSLAQTNAENYPINPDFQLQPHLTGLLLPQQSKKVPELYPVDKYNTSRGSIAENMNTNYFSSNKSFPEPKIIEYDMDETSTESSPQHTSSLYSESTDQDSESIPSNVQFSKHILNKNSECHVTKESKTIISSNQEFPVPSQFADLSLNADNSIDDDQHSILHSAYNQDNNIIEDVIQASIDNTTQNEIEPISENQENPESQFNTQHFNTSRTQTFNYYANKNDFGQTEFKYENTQDSPSIISDNKLNYSSYGFTDSSNIQNPSQFNTESYFSQSNTLTQHNSLNSSISQSLQSKSFPYSNIELLSRRQDSMNIQNYNDGTQSRDNSQNKHIESNFQNSNISPNDSKLQSNVVNSSITQNKQIFNQAISQAQTLNDHSSYQSINTSATNFYNQHSMYNSSKPPASELLNHSQPITSQQLTSLSSTQSIDPVTLPVITTPKSSSSISEDTTKENHNTPYQTSDDQNSLLPKLSTAAKNSSIELINQDLINIVKSELDNKCSISPNNNLAENRQEIMVDQSKSMDKQSNERQQNNITSSPPPTGHFAQPNSYLSSNNITSQQESNYQKPSTDQFTSSQSIVDDMKISNYQLSNSSINFVPHLDNTTAQQQSVSTTGHYFNSTNVNNQSVFNQQLPNLQSYSQQQNVYPQDIKSVVPDSPPLNKPNNLMTFSNSQNTSINLISLNQQQSPIKLELENSQLNSNNLSNETESVLIRSNNVNVKPLENTEISTLSSQASDNMTPNDQFLNVSVDNHQNTPVSQAFNQEQTSCASYFLKNTSYNDKNSTTFQNYSSTTHNTNNSVLELPEVNPSTQTNSQSPNLGQPIDHLLTNNETGSDKIPIVQSAINQFSPERFGNKIIPNAVPFVTTQSPLQMFSDQPKSGATPPFLPATSQCPTQLSNQSIPNVVPPVSLASTQLPPHSFSYQPKTDILPASQSTPSLYQLQPSNSQLAPTNVTPVSSTIKQFLPKTFSNQPTSTLPSLQSTPSPFPTQPFNSEPKPNTVLPVSSSLNQFPPHVFNSQNKLDTIAPLQPAASEYPVQSIQNTNMSAANQSIPQMFDNPPKSDIVPPFQHARSQYPAQPFSNQSTLNTILPTSTASQLPTQMFSNQTKLTASPHQTTSGQYPSQPFNNQHGSNMVLPVPLSVNQLPPETLNNQPKPDTLPIQPAVNQYPSLQPLSNQPRPNVIPPDSTTNQFSPQMVNIQPKLDIGSSNKPIASRYPSQMLSNQPMSSVAPIHQCPPQSFSNQSTPNTFPATQSMINQYPPQPSFNNQLGQQVLPKPNYPVPPSNQFYNQTNSAQPLNHNQWPPRPNINQTSQQSLSTMPLNIPNQANTMYPQPKTINTSYNSSTLPPIVDQQTQKLDSQMLPPSNNYYNQVQGFGNVQQSQPPAMLPNPNIQLATKGYPQQSNMGISNQMNYQQSNAVQGQHGFHDHQQDSSYRPEQNSSVVQQGFAKSWGYDNLDLLKCRDVLPSDGVQPPEIKLPQGYADCDNCSPDIFRCTLNKFPSSKNLLDKSRLPLGILIHPYKDLSRLTVIQCETITRCRNCRSYINPFVQFIDNAHWKCNLCYRVNELPGEFQIDPYTKTLGDPSRRPEIQNATIEYIASQDYMVRPPQPALYLFLLDVSRVATLTGYLEIVCDRILNKIMVNDIPGDSRTNIGFITYDSAVHFYQISNNDGGQPKQLVVSDITDIFLPLPDGLMVNLEENKSAVKDLLTSLPNLYKESYNTGCALGAALQAAFKILAPRGGRVTVFQACLPNCGPGSLQPRDDGNAHTGDRVQHMTPSTDYYKKLALECSAEQIAVDLFFISSQYLDIATISGISKYSAGCLHNFPQFDVKSPTIVTRFINCFDRYLTRKIGFEALLRLRCTRGVAIHSFHGNFFVRSSDLLMLPNVNPDNAYGMQLSIEDSLDGVSVVCFQAALLYTSSNAERRIRVHTLCIPVTDNLNDVFHHADQQAITCLIAKMAVDRSTEKSLSDAREAFFNAISDSLSVFKAGCSSYNGPGTMMSPLSLKVFPLYILATLKHAAFRTNQPTRLDERMFSMCQMKSLPLNCLIQYIYPDLYPIHSLEEQPKIDYEKLTEIPLPPVIQLSAERVDSNGIYLMDDSETLTIFIGHRCSDQLIQKLFGYVNVNSMPELLTTLTEVDSKQSYLLRSFISYLQHFKPYPLPIEIIKDNGPHKIRFYSRLIEDKFESSLSYYEFLQRLSQQVR